MEARDTVAAYEMIDEFGPPEMPLTDLPNFSMDFRLGPDGVAHPVGRPAVVLTPKLGVVTYCAGVTISAAQLKSGVS